MISFCNKIQNMHNEMFVSGWTRSHDLAISGFDASYIYKKLNYAMFQQNAYTSDSLKW